MKGTFRVGSWVVRRDLNLISRNGTSVQLEPKTMDVLVYLAEHSGEVIPKEVLLESIWSGTFVTDDVLRRSVSVLRRAFGDEAREPQVIETIAKRGYRLVAPVEPVGVDRSDGGISANGGMGNSRLPKHRPWRRSTAAASLSVLILIAVAISLWRDRATPGNRGTWVQITNLPDAVSQPALSRDGRMLVFIRGAGTFIAPGQVYVKLLPDGEPVPLTTDNSLKMSPTFSPDGSKVAYTALDGGSWNTWEVSISGKQPRLWLRNASGLSWVEEDSLLFSEVKSNGTMGIVAADADRTKERNLYLPIGSHAMAHFSYTSPDRKWALVVEMESGVWLPCRLVPMDAGSAGQSVGPPGAQCTSAAWSPDGKLMYFTSNVGGTFHIWRQPFPTGRPEQITFGPEEEQGIAVTSDGHALITSVGSSQSAVWLHDAAGEREISMEGYSYQPRFSPDGRALYYLKERLPGSGTTELWRADLRDGHREAVLPGVAIQTNPLPAYDVSRDGHSIVITGVDSEGKPRLWIVHADRSSPPRQLAGVEGDLPFFGEHGEIFFHFHESGLDSAYVSRIAMDGAGLRRVTDQPITFLKGISPDGRWLLANRVRGDDADVIAVPVDGGTPIPFLLPGATQGDSPVKWSDDGRFMFVTVPSSIGNTPNGRTFVVPLLHGKVFPPIPSGGFRSPDEIAKIPGVRSMDAVDVAPGPKPEIYAFTRETVQRNLYQIPLP